MAKTINIKNGTTKTLTIKKDSVINFTDLSTDSNYGILSNFTFKRSGKNLIIQNSSANINITVKNYFTTKNHGAYTKSKLQGLLFNGANQIGMGAGKIQQRAEYKAFEFDNSNNSAYATLFWDTIDLTGNDYKTKEKLNIYTGEGRDTIKFAATTAASSERTVYAGDNTNPTILNLEYLGNNTIKDISDSKGTLVFKSNTGKETYKISRYISKGKDNVQIKLANKDAVSLKDYLNNTVKKVFDYGKSTAKKQKLKGNFLNNNFEGCKGKDIIYCVDGNNTVNGRGGNDKIYAGKGADTFKYSYGNGWGRDTIYNSGSTDKIQFTDINPNDDALWYVKKGNNLVIEAYSWNYKKQKQTVSDTITLKNYFKSDKGKSINEKDRLGFINDTSIYDIAVRVRAGKFHNLGKGKYYIWLNKKNTTMVLDKTSDTTIVLDSNGKYNPKTQVETSYYQNVNGDVVTKKGNDLIVQYYTVKEKYSYKTHKLKRSIKKNNMTIKDYFSTDLTSSGRGKSGVNISNAKIYYYGDTQNVKQLVSNCEYVHLTASNKKEGDAYRIDSIDKSIMDVPYWVTGSKKNDRITVMNTSNNCIDSRGGNDIVHAEYGSANAFFYSAGYDNYISGDKNDAYYVGAILNSIDKFKKKSFGKSSKLHVRDTGGSDTMYISSKAKNLRLLFNVNKQGKVVVNQTFNLSKNDNKIWDSLMIYNKSALTAKNIQKSNFTGVIEMDNYFAVGTSSSSAVNTNAKGSGAIEAFKTNDKTLDMDSWVQRIASDVAGWLNSAANKKGYSTAADVFNSNDTASIKALLAIYNKDVYK